MLTIDHLVVAAPSIEEGIDWSKQVLGHTPESGGVHEGYGTHNVLIGLGKDAYLEIVSPDPHQSSIPPYWIPANKVSEPSLIGWAICRSNLKKLSVKHADYLGEFAKMQRLKTDGSVMKWEMTYPRFTVLDGLLPFFIDWKDALHPGKQLNSIGTINSLTLQHPKAQKANLLFDSLDIKISVEKAETFSIHADLEIRGKTITI